MGYNLWLGCHTHRVAEMIHRGDEAQGIRQFAAEHPKRDGCVVDVGIDHGFKEEPWMEEYDDDS